MSGRPTDPDWTIESFAPDASYPVGSNPWEGLPTKVAWAGASSVGFTPKRNIPAQAINYLFNKVLGNHDSVADRVGDVIDFIGQFQLNFPHSTVSAANTEFSFYVPAQRRWITVGASANVLSSVDWGGKYDATSLVAGVASGEGCSWGDYDNAGNVVVATNDRYVFQETASSGAWTKVDVLGGTFPGGNQGRVAYDPIHSKWIWVCLDTTIKPFTSTSRTSWTASTPFAITLAGGSTQLSLKVRRDTGVALIVARPNPTTFSVYKSSDGGVTWGSPVNITTPTGLGTNFSLHFDASSSTWMYVIGSAFSSTYTTQVWTSTDDGATWTRKTTLTTLGIVTVANDGILWVGIGQASSTSPLHLVYSLDAGATWQWAGQAFDGDLTGNCNISFGAGGFVATTKTRAYFGLRADVPGLGSVT